MNNIKEYISQNKERILNELFGLIRIPTVSGSADHVDDMQKAAIYLKENLLNSGADKVEIYQTEGAPIVYGEKKINESLQTVMIYGHYDVMPAGNKPGSTEGWDSPPFEPEIRNEKIYARGADDDKGQVFIQLKAFEYLAKTNQLNCNVKFILEGEEETGSDSIAVFCNQYKEMLKADIILVSDTGIIAQDTPSITVGLRGIAYMQVEVQGPNHDLHSGIYGGAVANPANVLTKMIAALFDENNHIAIPGFYDDVLVISHEERVEMAKAPYDEQKYCEALGIKSTYGEKGYSTLERTGIRPSLDINGIWSGFTQEGTKTVLPEKASAKISMRLVPNQQPDKIAKLFEDFLLSIAPKGVTVKVKYLHGGEPYVAPSEMIAYRAASKAYEKTFNKIPVPTRSGGSIPIISLFEKVLGTKSILMGFGLESDAIHAPNENFSLFNLFIGIETIAWFYQYYAEEMNK
ncbi:MAG: dipeptidase [Bacteroidota bacterium]